MKYDYYKETRKRVIAACEKIQYKDIADMMMHVYDSVEDCILEELRCNSDCFSTITSNDFPTVEAMLKGNEKEVISAYLDFGLTLENLQFEADAHDFAYHCDFTIRRHMTGTILHELIEEKHDCVNHLLGHLFHTYAPDTDMTFILYRHADYGLKVMGWYWGEPNDKDDCIYCGEL